jgi:hypothetical protein
MDFRMLCTKHLIEMSSGVTVASAMSQQENAMCRRERRRNLRIVARFLGCALTAKLAVLPVTQVMEKVVGIVRAQRSGSFRCARDREQTCLMVLDRHYHVGCCRFGYVLFLNHLYRSGRDSRTFQKPAHLRDFLWRQRFGMRRVKYLSVLADREQKSAVGFLPDRTDPIDEVRSFRPGDIARNRVPENRLECASIPIENPMRCCHSTRLRAIHITVKGDSGAHARQPVLPAVAPHIALHQTSALEKLDE